MKSLDRGDSGILGVQIQAAVVFADLCGFSALGAKHADHPHVSAFVGHHYLTLLENWARTEAGIEHVFIDKYVGDQIMLVVPGNRENSCQVALELARHWCMGIGLYGSSVGIHWGEVWFGDVGIRTNGNRPIPFVSYTVMGQTVNIASRLCGEAEAGEVLMLGLLHPLEPIERVPLARGWEVDVKQTDGLKNIMDGPLPLCRLRHPPLINFPWDIDEMLDRVVTDKPEAMSIDSGL